MANTLSETVDGQGLDTVYPLTTEQIESLHTRSWARLPGLLGGDDARRLREHLLAQAPREVLSGPDKQAADATALLQQEGVSWKDPEVMQIATSRRLASAVVGLMQLPEALFVHDLSFFKPVGSPPISWHQDFSYWPFDRQGNLSLWIALVDIDEEMGPLRYLEGSHLMGPLGLIDKGRDIRDTYPKLHDLGVGGGRSMRAGDAQAHWGLTVHSSKPNEGVERRDGMAFRYHRTDVRYTGQTHPHYDAFELEPGKTFAESGRFPRIGTDGVIDG